MFGVFLKEDSLNSTSTKVLFSYPPDDSEIGINVCLEITKFDLFLANTARI
jgi:hypothetical protein